MNLFRSEEHTRRWPLFNPRAEEGFISLAELAALFFPQTLHPPGGPPPLPRPAAPPPHARPRLPAGVVPEASRRAPRVSRADRQGHAVLARDAVAAVSVAAAGRRHGLRACL